MHVGNKSYIPNNCNNDGLLVVVNSKLLKRKEDKGFKGKD